MNSKFSKILTIIVAVISVIGIALFVNVSFTDGSPESVSSAVGPLIAFSLYLFCQIIFFCNVIWYSELRNKLIKLIQSPSFVNRFLTRWTTTKIKRKCRDANEIKHIAKIILCIEEENSTTIDWLVLDKLTKNKWMDFSILGISTQDGSLIKKIVAFSGIVYLVIGYF